eukprot:1150546-Pelagomonas_calceolata.AAC.2
MKYKTQHKPRQAAGAFQISTLINRQVYIVLRREAAQQAASILILPPNKDLCFVTCVYNHDGQDLCFATCVQSHDGRGQLLELAMHASKVALAVDGATHLPAPKDLTSFLQCWPVP